jgi:hypothetical protein
MDKELTDALDRLLATIERSGWEGYDPYDALNSLPLLRLPNKWLRVAPTVFFRLSPINLRRLFLVKKGINPKAMGLLLSAYSLCHRLALVPTMDEAGRIFEWLCRNASPGYSGFGWGYNFPWQSRDRLLAKGIPTIVNTSYVGHGILDYYDRSGNPEALDAARSACDFILKDLNIRETEEGICFSYSPVESHIVHNANALGASLLARVSSYTREAELAEWAERSFDFTLHHQQQNGLWAYSIYPDTGHVRTQTDWHQGFILDSLMWFISYAKPPGDKARKALEAGAAFYNTQFTKEGMGFWRLPKKWPADIHNQAQGIITFAKLEEYIPGSLHTAQQIAQWTIRNLMNKNKGYFYYQKWPLYTNRIAYFRWAQAWMLLALATLLAHSSSSPATQTTPPQTTPP